MTDKSYVLRDCNGVAKIFFINNDGIELFNKTTSEFECVWSTRGRAQTFTLSKDYKLESRCVKIMLWKNDRLCIEEK